MFYLTKMLLAVMFSDTWQNLQNCDVLLVRSDGDCGYTFHGKAYAHLLDSFSDLCVNRGLVTRSVATPYSRLIGIQAYNSPVSYNRTAFFIGLLRRCIQLVRGSANSMNWANERRNHFWMKILEKAKPRCVIAIQPDEGLCWAGKVKSIPVYDYQHGVIDDQNPWYGKKYRADTSSRYLPDGFLCWDEHSADTLRKWAPQKGIEIRVVGNPWFLRFQFVKPYDFLVQEALKCGKIFNNNRPVILVSLQWGMDLFYKYTGFSKVMVEALEKTITETADSYNWLLRLHPVQIRGVEKEIAHRYLTDTFGHLDSVEWRTCSELPLPVVLKQADMHITDMSTVVIEAAWMGVYSALLNNNICPGGCLEKIYSHERGVGIAEVLLQDTKIIKQWISNRLVKGRGESTLKNTDKAIQAFIEEIVENSVMERNNA